MTVSATTRKAGPYTGNGASTAFAFYFKVFAKTDIAVVKANPAGIETTLVLDSDYSVTLNADQSNSPGGSVTYPLSGAALVLTERLVIVGGLSYNQTTTLPNGGAYNASVAERALDRLTILVQQVLEIASRGVQLATTAATNVSARLPVPVANYFLAWNAEGTALTNLNPVLLVEGQQAFSQWVLDIFTGTNVAGQTVVLSQQPGGINNLDVSINGSTKRAGLDFTLSGTSLTFTAAVPISASNIAVRYGRAVPSNEATVSVADYGSVT